MEKSVKDESESEDQVSESVGDDAVDPAELAARQEAKRVAREARKQKAEAEKKDKRKAKKVAKEKAKVEEKTAKTGGQTKPQPPTAKTELAPKPQETAKGSTEIMDGQKKTTQDEEISEKKVEEVIVEHKDDKNTALRIGKDLIVISNAEFEKLEEIRKKRERDAKDKEIERKKLEALKEESKVELEKLQEKLAVKNQMKNKKSKKH